MVADCGLGRDNGISGPKGWGAEIDFRSKLEDEITRMKEIPLVLIIVEGGPGSLRTVLEGVKNKFPVIVVAGSGRAADVIAARWRMEQGVVVDSTIFNGYEKHMDTLEEIVAKGKEYKNIHLFDLMDDKTSDLNKVILRAILVGKAMVTTSS